MGITFSLVWFHSQDRPWNENVADAPLRLAVNISQCTFDAQVYARFVVRNAVPNAILIQKVEEESVNDTAEPIHAKSLRSPTSTRHKLRISVSLRRALTLFPSVSVNKC